MPLGIHSKTLLHILCVSDSSSTINLFFFFFLIVCLFVCVVDHGVNEGEPVDEQYYEPMNENPFRDPEPEGQYFNQDLPEGFEDGKFNPIL